MTRLLVDGCGVEGDEMVLVRDGRAVAYPRRFGIRRRTLALVPRVGALVPHLLADAPAGDALGGFHVLALDPEQLGLPWRIGCGPIDVIFLLGPRGTGATHLAPCPTPVVLQRLLAQSVPPNRGQGGWVRDLSEAVRTARAYTLELGDLDSAAASVRECLARRARALATIDD